MSNYKKIKKEINNGANYAEATQPVHNSSKIKFSEVQDIIKLHHHNKKINEIMYDIPDSYSTIDSFQNILIDKNYEVEQCRREEYSTLIKELDEMVKNADVFDAADNHKQRDLIRTQRDLIHQVSKIHKREREREYEREKEREYGHRRDAEFIAEMANLENELLNNYLYPFHYLRNDRENIGDDVKARLASYQSKIILLK